MALATKNGSLIVKNGNVAENCNCCGGWYCYKSACPCSIAAGTMPSCPFPGCLPEYIKISFAANFPPTTFAYYNSILQHDAVSFSGELTLQRGARINGLYDDRLPVTWAIDYRTPPSSYNVFRLWVKYYATQSYMEMIFQRKIQTTTVLYDDPCKFKNTYNYGTMTTSIEPSDESIVEWAAVVFFDSYGNGTGLVAPQTPLGLSQSDHCYGSGSSNKSVSQHSEISSSKLALTCEERGYSSAVDTKDDFDAVSVTVLDSYV